MDRWRWGWVLGGLLLGWGSGWGAEESMKISLKAPALLEYDGSKEEVRIVGGLRIEFRDVEVEGQQLTANLKERWALLEGGILLRRGPQALEGRQVRVNLRTGEFEVEQVASTLTPEALGGATVAPVYLQSERIQGERGGLLRGQGVVITSCDRPRPHYDLRTPRLILVPDRRLVFEGGSFQVLGHPLLRLPRFSLPLQALQQGRPTFLPSIGRSEVEGFYVKYNYNYGSAAEGNYGALHLDWLEQQGLRLGGEHHYLLGSGRGHVLLDYTLQSKALTARWEHQHRWGRWMEVTSNGNYTENNYFSLTTRALNAEAQWSYRGRSGQGQLSQRWSQAGQQKSQYLTWRATSRWGGTSLQSSLQYSRRSTLPGNPEDRELLTEFSLNGQAPWFSWSLRDSRRFDPDAYEGDRFYAATESLPVLVLETDDRRLNLRWWRGAQGRYQLSLGRFQEVTLQAGQPRTVKVTRFQIRADLAGQPIRLGSWGQWTWSGGIDQSVFSDQTAQYVLNAQTSLDLRPSSLWETNLRYTYTEPAGFSPLRRFDFAYHTSDFSLSARYRSRRSLLSLNGGADLRRGGYQPLSLAWDFRPGSDLQTTLYTTYHLDGRGLGFGNLSWRWGRRGGPFWQGVLLYDFQRSRLSNLRMVLDTPLLERWRVQSWLGYNGFTKRVDYNDLLLSYDLHCWQAAVFYSRQRHEFQFNLVLKALGFGVGNPGIGRYGQRFDTSFGRIF